MNRKFPFIMLVSGSLLIVLAMLFALPAQNVAAQCKGVSSCKDCHEVQGQKPINTVGAWHTDHASFDVCVSCHAGNRDAIDLASAHTGLVTKFADMGGNCKQCHSDDLDKRLTIYAKTLNISDITAIKNKPAANPAASLSNFLGTGASGPTTVVAGAGVSAPAKAAQPARKEDTTANLILGGMLVIGLVGGGSYVAWNERRLKQAQGERTTALWLRMLRRESWSPYAAGTLLGIACILSALLAHRLLGVSAAVSSIGSTLLTQTAPDATKNSMYFKFLIPPGFNWEIALLIGIFFGGFFAALSSGTFRLRWNDDPVWIKVFGTQRWKRAAVGFFGAVIVQFGAGIAGGCTSGLAISGGMLMAPSAFLFMAGMFASGIVAAILVFRKRY